MHQLCSRLAALFVLPLAIAAAASAQPGFSPFGGGANTTDEPVKVSARAGHTSVPAGGDTFVTVIMEIADGWKVWTNEREYPADVAVFSGAILTAISDASSENTGAFTAHPKFTIWPESFSRSTVDVGDGPQQYPVFEGRVIMHVPVTIAADAPAGQATVRLTVSYQACTAISCDAPTDDIVTARFEITESDQAPVPNPAAQSLLASFDPSVFAAIRAGDTPPGADLSPAPLTAGPVSRPTIFGWEVPPADSPVGLFVVAILAALGGFLLNLTPCVLPVLPIKIMTLSKHAETPGRTLVLGLWMAIGVVAFWVALGVPAAFVSSLADPSRLFGIWWLTLTIGLLIALMGIGIMGLFTINLPGAVYAVNPRADSAWGSFLFGVMTGVLGLPCFGFVAGALLAGSATLPWANIMIIFTALGVGMAAPYLVLSMKPGLVDSIPRTGPASDLVKQVMGLLLIAAALYFVGSGLMTLVSEKPWLGGQLHLWAITTVACLSGLWLIVRTWSITPSVVKRGVFSVIGIVIGGVALLFTISSTEAGKRHYEAQARLMNLAADAYTTEGWNAFSEERLAAARRDGKVVVLDFTASWCINCIALKRAILDVNPVRTMLTADDTVAITVDLSSRTAPGWAKHAALGQTGIPLLVIYAGEDEPPALFNIYTSDVVTDAVERARKRVAAARTEQPITLATDDR